VTDLRVVSRPPDRRRFTSPWTKNRRAHVGLPTLIVGGGGAARTLARDLRESPDYGLWPIGCLDDDPKIRSVSGLPVFGGLPEMRRVIREHNVAVVVIAIPSLPLPTMSSLIREAAGTGAHVRFLPSFLAALQRDARAADMRVVQLNALLGRPERSELQPRARDTLAGARVLVTGAGGSIGQELCRQIRSCDPSSLSMLDHDESNLHTLQLALEGEALLNSTEVIVADVRDKSRIEQIFSSLRPQIVFHAAAHKHLPLLERHPCEGVKSNVLGTEIVIKAALKAQAERFVLISTDKAADPKSILGATKRLAEIIVQAHANEITRVCSVRFGNVLGSRGSFLTVVAEQLDRGVPVTVTDPDVTRFFMTVEEAVRLVLSAASMAEYGETFVLDMGEPVQIVELVRRYAAQLHIFDVPIRYTGLRPGEKLHELLFSESEERFRTIDPGIWATRPSPLPGDLEAQLAALYTAASDGEELLVRKTLSHLLPAYQPDPIEDSELIAALMTPYGDEF
jgi:FlaA1/EpsC-like NDP-sugar epimerase